MSWNRIAALANESYRRVKSLFHFEISGFFVVGLFFLKLESYVI